MTVIGRVAAGPSTVFAPVAGLAMPRHGPPSTENSPAPVTVAAPALAPVLAQLCPKYPAQTASPQPSAAAYGRPRPAEVSVLPSPNAQAVARAWMRSPT